MDLKKLSVTKSTIKEKCMKIDMQRAVPLAVLVLVLAAQNYGFAADSTTEIEAQTKSVVDMICSPWIRKIGLAFGAGMGIFQAWSAGSFKPLMLWGGLGLSIGYVPKLIELIASV